MCKNLNRVAHTGGGAYVSVGGGSTALGSEGAGTSVCCAVGAGVVADSGESFSSALGAHLDVYIMIS
jgi:hypothetical protein